MTPERFWKKIQISAKDDCWLWKRYTDREGYGRVGFEGKSHTAHRVAYILTFGDFDRTLDVCHRCDNPPCCNPNHLFLGTAKVNVNDAIQKGRWPSTKGENHPGVKLMEEQVQFIRKQWKPGYGNAAKLARQFNVSSSCIWGILIGKNWKGV